MLGACIGGAVGGLVGGFFQMKCFGIATPAIVTIVQYVEKGKPQTLLFAAPPIHAPNIGRFKRSVTP